TSAKRSRNYGTFTGRADAALRARTPPPPPLPPRHPRHLRAPGPRPASDRDGGAPPRPPLRGGRDPRRRPRGRADAACAGPARGHRLLRRAGAARRAIHFVGGRGRDAAEAEPAVDGYLELARRLSEAPPTASAALDLSHVGQDVSAEFCLRQLERIVDALPARRARARG